MTDAGNGGTAPGGRSTALLTDRYELTMVDAALRSGQASKRAVFELFTRTLPPRRAYGVVAGTARAIQAVVDFRFGLDELDWLGRNGVVSPAAMDYLADYRFSGDIWGFREGDLYVADSPVLTVEAPFAEAVVLETVLLSIFNHDSAVASAVTRMVDAAGAVTVLPTLESSRAWCRTCVAGLPTSARGPDALPTESRVRS